MFLTGLPTAFNILITARFQSDQQRTPEQAFEILYSGAAPGVPGVQQVNLRIPSQLSAGAWDLAICGLNNSNIEACSTPSRTYIRP